MSGTSKIDSTESISGESSSLTAKPKVRERKKFFIDHPRMVALLLFLFDVCILLLLCVLGYSWRVGVDAGESFFEVAFTENRLVQIVCYTASILAMIGISGAYRVETAYRTLNYVAEFILSVVIGSFVGLFLIYVVLARYASFSPESRFGLVLASLVFLIPGLLTRLWISNKNQEIREQRPILVFGRNASLKEFKKNYHLTGLRNPIKLVNLDTDQLVFGAAGEVDIGNISWTDVRADYEAVVLMEEPATINATLMEKLVHLHFDHLPVFTLSAFYAIRWRQVPVLNLGYAWALEQDFDLARRSYYRYVKDSFDLLFGGILFFISLPLMVVVAIIVKLDSTGPIIFIQERTGRDGRPFNLFKFRTMKVHAPSKSADLYTQKDDPRITRVGNFLRRTRLDELPQLLNIWLGNMSLIGPRAEWTKLVAKYEKEIPGYHLRHLVKPGITGWAQLNYPYGESLEDTVEKLKYDLYYIKHYSPILDLEIVLKTVLAVVFFRGK